MAARSSVVEFDGRVLRGERNREAIIDALLACYAAGVLRPSAAQVAERAGVSSRSVHNHFADMETLRAEVAERQWLRVEHLAAPPELSLPLAARISELVAKRASLYEAVTPVRRAALLSVHESPSIRTNLTRLGRTLRRQLAVLFEPELAGGDPLLLDALDLLTSWDAWDRLRSQQGRSIEDARRVMTACLLAVLDVVRNSSGDEGSSP